MCRHTPCLKLYNKLRRGETGEDRRDGENGDKGNQKRAGIWIVAKKGCREDGYYPLSASAVITVAFTVDMETCRHEVMNFDACFDRGLT